MSRALGFGPFLFDEETLSLSRDGDDVPIPPRAAAVLGCLLRRPGKVVLKDDLLEAAWPDSFVSEDSLTHAISVIRQCLDDDARVPRYVQTVPKRGYRFVAEVRVADWPTPLADAPTASSDPGAVAPAAAPAEVPHPAGLPRRPSPPQQQSVPPAVAVMLAVSAVAVLLVVLALLPWQGSGPVAPASEAALQIRTLAVAEPVADAQLRELALDVQRALVAALDRHTEFSVLAADANADAEAGDASSGVAYADSAADAVLSGTIEERGSRLLLAFRITSANGSEDWWHHEWLLPPSLFTAEEFAASLSSRAKFLFDLTSAYSTVRGSGDPDAVRLAVQASQLLLGPAMLDLRVAAEAADALRRAVEIDPHFARARAGRVAILAESIYWQPWTEEDHARAAEELARAAEDDPDDAVVEIARALLALNAGQPEAMSQAVDRAAQLDPRLFWAYMIRADLERHAGLFDPALATIRRGLALDPYLPALHDRLIEIHLDAGDYEAASLATDTLVELMPDSYFSERALARLLWRRGDHAEAEAHLAGLRDRFGDSPWVYRLLHDIYVETGETELADRMAEAYRALSR